MCVCQQGSAPCEWMHSHLCPFLLSLGKGLFTMNSTLGHRLDPSSPASHRLISDVQQRREKMLNTMKSYFCSSSPGLLFANALINFIRICFRAERFNISCSFSEFHSVLLDICPKGLIVAHVYGSGSYLDQIACRLFIFSPA